MARCTATPPCNYKANGEIHDPGCPMRAAGISNPELAHLYDTETIHERATLAEVLEHLIDRDLLDTEDYADATPDDVAGTDEDWFALRRAVREDNRRAAIADLAAGFHLTAGPDGPALHPTRPTS